MTPLFARGLLAAAADPVPTKSHAIGVPGTRFRRDGEPFPYTGLSFFNAVYNPAFNGSSADRHS